MPRRSHPIDHDAVAAAAAVLIRELSGGLIDVEGPVRGQWTTRHYHEGQTTPYHVQSGGVQWLLDLAGSIELREEESVGLPADAYASETAAAE